MMDAVLVDHERTDDDLLALEAAVFNQRILFIEVCNKCWTIMPSVALGGEDKSTAMLSAWV